MLALISKVIADVSYNTDPTLSASNSAGNGVVAALMLLLGVAALVLCVFEVIGMWKMYEKAGRPGWAVLVPFYNLWVLAEIAGKPGWWSLSIFLAFIPFVGWIVPVVISILIALGLAQRFGKSEAFGIIGLFLFSVVGYMILGFGPATYHSDTAGTTPSATPTTPVSPTAPSGMLQ